MSSAVAELEAGLQAMLSLKPPGVSGSRISSITNLCVNNVQSESVLIQKLYTHFKKAPPTHKLGVLYVVDSVTRKWTEQAKNAGQPINTSAQDGTFAAGVNRVQELLPVLMNDIIQTAPSEQKEKINKLIDIWEKGQTFPVQMLTNFKEKLAPALNQAKSYTPPGSPPSNPLGLQNQAQPLNPSAPVASTVAPNSVLAALGQLANMARQNNSLGQSQDSQFKVTNGQSNAPLQAPVLNQALPLPPPPPVNVPATFANQAQGSSNGAPNFASNQTSAFAAAPPAMPTPLDSSVQQQIMLIKALSESGMPPDQIAGIISRMGNQGSLSGVAPVGSLPLPQFPIQNQNTVPQNGHNGQSVTQNGSHNGWGARQNESRDHDGFERRRSRSPSPARGWNGRASPTSRRRNEQNFENDRSPGRNRDDRGRGDARGGRDYRQRSPPRRRSSTPPRYHGGGEKWVGHDSTVPQGSIKVLSRTLFVGGVTMPEHELRRIFEPYGRVQTCIVNKDKRHAFVKMYSRADSVKAREGMEKNRSPDSQLRTRWGVGFGPRDCSDYQTGVSVIPIGRLTDADRKWMLTAEYGGTGGKPIESGIVVEEPDIEIGQGVSSKAISRRMQTDQGGKNGPKSNRGRDDDGPRHQRRGSRERNDDRREDGNDRFSQSSAPPPVPAFGLPNFPFSFPTLPNGMPMMPPGFTFPGQSQTPPQPPPPGRS
ncbi:hypothetical protein B0O99DRAFT_653419 [Bisporella sp. PMI_857]|nr:hypothetical protein B0O99DRAFT_653419 [Bisporella sp. PMI_857]